MRLLLETETPQSDGIGGGIITGLEKWCREANQFFIAFFLYMKFIFAFILLIIGLLTLSKMRGIYKTERLKQDKFASKKDSPLYKPRLILGLTYIIMSLGIIFNYFTYFLIYCLEPLPDGYIFNFLNFSEGIDPKSINRMRDIDKAKFEYEKTVYYCIAVVSFFAILDVVLSITYIVNNAGKDYRKAVKTLIGGIVAGILVGWTTCLPLFL